jgi:hypothetical protein
VQIEIRLNSWTALTFNLGSTYVGKNIALWLWFSLSSVYMKPVVWLNFGRTAKIDDSSYWDEWLKFGSYNPNFVFTVKTVKTFRLNRPFAKSLVYAQDWPVFYCKNFNCDKKWPLQQHLLQNAKCGTSPSTTANIEQKRTSLFTVRPDSTKCFQLWYFFCLAQFLR